MKHTRRTALILTCLALAACAPKTASPRAQAVYASISIVDAIHALQASAIDANRLKALSDADSIAIVQWTRVSALTIEQVPDGWQPAVLKGWDELAKLVPPERLAQSATLRILWASLAATMNEIRKGL